MTMKNKSSLTIPQAVKVYTGNSFIANTLEASAVFIGILCFTIVVGLTIAAISKGFDIDAMKESFINNRKNGDTYVLDIYIGMFASLFPALMSLAGYTKDYPGGKYFRTVQGEFDTFRKFTIGSYIAAFIEIAIFFLFIVLSQIYRLTTNGLTFVISMFIFCLLCAPVTRFTMTVRNIFLRSMALAISCLLTTGAGVMTPTLAPGVRAVILAAAAVLTMVLTPISLKVYLKNYRQHLWTE